MKLIATIKWKIENGVYNFKQTNHLTTNNTTTWSELASQQASRPPWPSLQMAWAPLPHALSRNLNSQRLRVPSPKKQIKMRNTNHHVEKRQSYGTCTQSIQEETTKSNKSSMKITDLLRERPTQTRPTTKDLIKRCGTICFLNTT